MVESYKKLLDMKSVAAKRLEQDKLVLGKINSVIYQDKEYILDILIQYLKNELNIEYDKYKVKDINGNVADILVKKSSDIFKEHIEGKEYINFDIENFLDNRLFNNEDEIIIVNLNLEHEKIDLGYLCKTLGYYYLSYSKRIVSYLELFINYVINRGISEEK